MNETSQQLRVLVVTNLWPFRQDPSHGAFVASQMRSIERRGVSVDVLFVNGRRNTLAYAIGAAKVAALNLRRRRYDLIHAHAGHAGLLARLQCRYPIVLSYVGYDVHGKVKADRTATRKSRIESKVFRWLAGHVAATITKSAEMEGYLPPLARRRNTVLPNGVDRNVFTEIDRGAARARLGWPLDELTVVFVGRSDAAGKRVQLAQEACDLARRDIPRLAFRICKGHAHDEVPVWLNAADALVLPSLAEGSPNVVKEALACNLPVVATDVGDVRELLEGVSRCRVVPVEVSAQGLAHALTDVLRDAPCRNDGRLRTAHLDSDQVAERLLQVYRSVLDPPRAGVVENVVSDVAPL
jgi:teichuronic acid biosynthesis glycosyltransferase TuaC